MIRLVIAEPTPSLNEIGRGRVAGWKVMKSLHRKWAPMVQLAIAQARAAGMKVDAADRPRRILIERHGVKPLDWDNLCGGCKVLLDELKKFKLILDDDHKNLDARAVNVPLARGEEPHTVVVLEDIA